MKRPELAFTRGQKFDVKHLMQMLRCVAQDCERVIQRINPKPKLRAPIGRKFVAHARAVSRRSVVAAALIVYATDSSQGKPLNGQRSGGARFYLPHSAQ
jgi:hypothetical protein